MHASNDMVYKPLSRVYKKTCSQLHNYSTFNGGDDNIGMLQQYMFWLFSYRTFDSSIITIVQSRATSTTLFICMLCGTTYTEGILHLLMGSAAHNQSIIKSGPALKTRYFFLFPFLVIIAHFAKFMFFLIILIQHFQILGSTFCGT